ncbi:fumarylacetoacetate hydrolase family protein [Pseudooceanicola spongiae]|uniref:5-carboxymethyl-2-hydroxymuconate isomerase n=1 Tax=Pseudooceanicola spongiae TaxID=2613965 RepID=A0A7L9WT02_9RHOB|nr:fumarylacetoacetate hydrolase family protein [Pseudooceanicola spongiae]QOL83012.1 5-carboxymethyl-2-hydroxymuconate isomerase [Pseudooceanicola spongiae]
MKFATVRSDNRTLWGVIEDSALADLSALYPSLRDAVEADFAGVDEALADAPRIAFGAFSYLPVIPNPDKIICVGLNYENHRKETGRKEVAQPTIFSRFANSQLGHDEAIVMPKVSSDLDYEGELAIVIGKPGRYITREDAMSHIAGYACYNDGSLRDYQWHTHQFTPGKNFPATGAFGPYMMTPDELGPLAELTLSTRLNGEVMQQAQFKDMIFDLPDLIVYCSEFTELVPGDVIVTGTPGGVGAKRTPPLWMKPGDVVEIEIERLGTLRNTIIAE